MNLQCNCEEDIHTEECEDAFMDHFFSIISPMYPLQVSFYA